MLPNVNKRKEFKIEKPWLEGLKALDQEDVTMQEVYQSFIDDTMMEHPELTMPQARVLVRNAINQKVVGDLVRKEIEYFMVNGRYWHG